MSGGRTALLLSPHLDDVAFSCGGVAASLAEAGWRVVIATAFTRGVHPAAGFALACQRDKGLADDIDYMARRRSEDRAACAMLGAEQMLLDLPEAPHRGYDSVAALFGPRRPDDLIAGPLAELLAPLLAAADLVLAPQGCGRHVDHLCLLDALFGVRHEGAGFGFYRDTPYVIREPGALPDDRVAASAPADLVLPLAQAALSRKQRAAACYATQLGYQFGGASAAMDAIALLARAEGGGVDAERFRVGDASALAGWRGAAA